MTAVDPSAGDTHTMTNTAVRTAAGSDSPEVQPCRCHQARAAVTPTHPGHCCFWPATQTCHQAEMAAWTENRQ